MKFRLSKFKDFLQTPFPYLILVLSVFMAWTLLSNPGFGKGLSVAEPNLQDSERYELCLVCSGPGAKDALSDVGFTAANFFLFPVTLVTLLALVLLGNVALAGPALTYSVYYGFTIIYALAMPFLIFLGYENVTGRLRNRTVVHSVFTR